MSAPVKRFVDELYTWQLDVLRAFDADIAPKKRFFLLKCHRKSRKTSLLLNILIRECCRFPKSVYPFVGPTYKQAKSIVWRDPNMLFSFLPDKADFGWEANETELFIEFENGSILPIKGADDPDSLRGLDARGVGFDEWALQKLSVWQEIFRPIITQDSQRWAMFAYTPKGYTHATRMEEESINWPDWYKITLKASESGILDHEELVKAAREMPTALYDQEFECADITDEENVLISSRMLDNLKGLAVIAPPGRKIVSCDPALDRGDECITYALVDTKVVDMLIQRERDTTKIAAKVVEFAHKHSIKAIVIDADGLGKGVADMAQKLFGYGENRVIQFVSGKGCGNKKYKNWRTEAWFLAWRKVMDKRIAYPEDPELRHQISSIKYIPSDYADQLRIEPKEKTKERLGHSPDRADAWVMGIWAEDFVKYPIEQIFDHAEEEAAAALSYSWQTKI